VNNTTVQLKVRQRLNKLASNDFDNIECWQIIEAFNKAQLEWARRQIRGSNLFQDGDEQSTRRIDDLQKLLIEISPPLQNKQDFYETLNELPEDFLEYKRIDAYASKDCCDGLRKMIVYLVEEDNLTALLRDDLKKPSYKWGETFSTLINNKARVHTNGDFEVDEIKFIYYRKPILIQIAGCKSPYSGTEPVTDVDSEFKDDIVELIIDETVAIIGGDIESGNQFSRGSEAAERSN
jgi:hypothetical protein